MLVPASPFQEWRGGKKTSVKIWSHWGMPNWCLSSASLPLSQFSPPFNSLPFETAGLGWSGPPARPCCSYRPSPTSAEQRAVGQAVERKKREKKPEEVVGQILCRVRAEGFLHCDERKTNNTPPKQTKKPSPNPKAFFTAAFCSWDCGCH